MRRQYEAASPRGASIPAKQVTWRLREFSAPLWGPGALWRYAHSLNSMVWDGLASGAGLTNPALDTSSQLARIYFLGHGLHQIQRAR